MATKIRDRKLTTKQVAVLKIINRKPHTAKETATLLNNAANRSKNYTRPYNIYHTYDAIHSCLRGLEDRGFVRRTYKLSIKGAIWELTSKGRDEVAS